jgi:hypothetical protein
VALDGDSLENGLSHDHAEYARCHLEEIHCVFAAVELVESSGSVAKLHEAELGIEDLLDAESHPLAQESASVGSLLLVLEDDLDLFIEVNAFKLVVAGHEDVFLVHFEVV